MRYRACCADAVRVLALENAVLGQLAVLRALENVAALRALENVAVLRALENAMRLAARSGAAGCGRGKRGWGRGSWAARRPGTAARAGADCWRAAWLGAAAAFWGEARCPCSKRKAVSYTK